jgi:hypothetical protein
MQLSSHQLSSVVAGLRTLARLGASSEKRVYSRFNIAAPVELFATIEFSSMFAGRFTAITRDLSHGGIGLLQSLNMAAGAEFVIRLPLDPKGVLLMLCRVQHSGPAAHGIYVAGCEFVREVDLAFLQQLVAHHHEARRIRDVLLQ